MKNLSLKKLVLTLLIIFATIFLGAISFILFSGFSDHVNKADVIIVFGNKVEVNGQPSNRLKARLDKAVQLFQQGYSPVIIVSGGIEANGFDEAQVMKTYLIQSGIPEISIFSDNQGVDTYNTARNTTLLMRQNGWSSVIIVSQFFHIARARLAFERFGIQTIYTVHAAYFELRDLYSLGREVVALLVYYVRKYY